MTESIISPVAIVTGASRGLGAAIARVLASKGYNLVLTYRSGASEAEMVKSQCEAAFSNIQVVLVAADISLEADCKRIIDVAKETFGRVDVLVNNAGMTRDGLAMRMSREQFTSVIDTNLTGAVSTSSLCLPIMVKQRKGRIINISSVSGVYGNAGQANYSASKAGLIGMTKSMAKEMAKRNITVNAVAPGFIETDMTDALGEETKKAAMERIPMARFGKPEDVANVVAFLASDESAYVTGQVIEVSGGLVI